jgi:hypothetical protein
MDLKLKDKVALITGSKPSTNNGATSRKVAMWRCNAVTLINMISPHLMLVNAGKISRATGRNTLTIWVKAYLSRMRFTTPTACPSEQSLAL